MSWAWDAPTNEQALLEQGYIEGFKDARRLTPAQPETVVEQTDEE